MVWPAVIGAGGKLAGSVVSGLFGGQSGPSARDLAWESEEIRRAATNWDMRNASRNAIYQGRALTSLARTAGIHPLAALGVPMAGSASATPIGSSVSGSTMGDGIGVGIAGAADSIGKALRVSKDAKREAAWRSMESGRLALEEQQARIDNLSASTAREAAEARKVMAEARSRSLIAAVERQPGGDAEVLTLPSGSWRTSDTTKQQDVEDNYGGIVGEGYGMWRAINDIFIQPRRPQVFNSPKSRAPVSADNFYPELY